MPDFLGDHDLGKVIVDHGIKIPDQAHAGLLQIIVIGDVVDMAERIKVTEAALDLDACHRSMRFIDGFASSRRHGDRGTAGT